MQAYGIIYTVGKGEKEYSVNVDAKDVKSAKKKIGRKHGYKTGNMIKLQSVHIIGYF